ncbi:MAG: hypothetical protein E4H46_05215 [Desulfobacterales bacterium]|nr:MAG: hypothetical protein E4H46_05215 [Desulfobacterales bacterium]
MKEMERNQILRALSETRWRIEGKNGAALLLGLHPSTLRAKMHKLGIVGPNFQIVSLTCRVSSALASIY